jgi:hypothetical protein
LVASQQPPPQQFLARKGQALIWAANLMHGGSPQLNKALTRWSQVTHYFFENCAYYTPMMSDPFFGKIDFRKLVNINTGLPMPHHYAGETISTHFIDVNPDVAANGANPFEHYLRHGRKEKRRLRP